MRAIIEYVISGEDFREAISGKNIEEIQREIASRIATKPGLQIDLYLLAQVVRTNLSVVFEDANGRTIPGPRELPTCNTSTIDEATTFA